MDVSSLKYAYIFQNPPTAYIKYIFRDFRESVKCPCFVMGDKFFYVLKTNLFLTYKLIKTYTCLIRFSFNTKLDRLVSFLACQYKACIHNGFRDTGYLPLYFFQGHGILSILLQGIWDIVFNGSKEEGKYQESIQYEIPHQAKDTIWESDKIQENITLKRAKRPALPNRRPQGCKEQTTRQYDRLTQNRNNKKGPQQKQNATNTEYM